ncbi:MAG: nucleoside recognition protein [Lachnospiraceae bacterium]|jgi:spore maturation protein A|nr:nucleoside recognition protein [Lachnospiraceae bacterium]
MMNWLWAGMILAGIIWGMFHGTLAEVTDGAIASAGEAVTLCITMLGIMSFWTGILEIGSRSGVIEAMVKKMRPVLKFLFPRLSMDHPAAESIATNMIANMLGMGWAATPAGLKAMEELAKLETERRNPAYLSDGKRTGEMKERVASNEMCTFLILNISSLQLIPVNMIAYRQQYGSVNPAGIIAPAIVATFMSTLTAVIYCKIMDRKHRIF